MFETTRLIINRMANLENGNLTLNQRILILCAIIDESNINLLWLLFEIIVYCIFESITGLYNYILWGLIKPFQTLQHIRKICSTVHYQIYPAHIRNHMYIQLFKILIYDVIRAIILFIVYFQIQKLFMWKK